MFNKILFPTDGSKYSKKAIIVSATADITLAAKKVKKIII